jgi:hypothetical protein
MTHPNKGNKHATKPPHLRRTALFTARCTTEELEGYKELKAEFDEGRKTPTP